MLSIHLQDGVDDENNPDLKYVSILGANLTMTKVEEITLS